jgi:hypothetical protein
MTTWKFRNGKHKSFNEGADPVVVSRHCYLGDAKTPVMEWASCPFCGGTFGVDADYINSVDDIIHCPICCMEVQFATGKAEGEK